MPSNDCDAMRALLAGYLYDDLPAAERERVEAHLAGCDGCRAALAAMREASSALNAWVLPPARTPARRRYRESARLPVLGWAAAAALFLLAVTVHLTTRPPAQEKPSQAAEPPAPPEDPVELERVRREIQQEIARLDEERRRARERLQEIEREREKLEAEKAPETDPAPPALARVEAERKKTEEDLKRTRDARRQAEQKLVRAETRGTVAVIAQLEWVQGEVRVLSPEGMAPARTAKALVSGQGLETAGPDSLAVLVFPDSTRLEIGPATEVRALSNGDSGKHIELARGTLRADVARQPPSRPLVIRTPEAEARVLGTRLRVVSQGATRLEVQEGRVRLTRARDNASVEVTGGNYAVTNVPRMLPKPIREAAFQDGVSPVPAYAGTRDTFLSELNATHPYGANRALQVDGDNPGGSGKELRALLRWDLSAIPPGSRIQTASILLRVSTLPEPPYAVYAMKRAWSEPQATWQTSAGDHGTATLGHGFPSGADEFSFPLNAEGVALVQSWIDAPASNFGFMITAPGNSNGMKAHSREAPEPRARPKLVLTYTPRENR